MEKRYLYKVVDVNSGQSMWRWFKTPYQVGKTYNGQIANEEKQIYVEELIHSI